MLIAFAAMAASARADDGWFGGLNPWSPNYNAHANRKKSSPYIGSRVVNGSKNVVGGARDMMPWRRSEKRKTNEFIDGTGRFFRPDLAQKEDEKPRFGWVRPASWFVEPEPQQPDNMADWIGLPRPGM
jgi:hypothetical protein